MIARLFWLATLLLASTAALAADRPRGLGDVKDVRYWSHPDYTRVVVELDRPVEAVLRRLPADASRGKPERLFLDLDGIWVGQQWQDGIAIDDGLVRRVRLGQNTRRRARLVLDLDRLERHRLLHLTSPERLVIDVYGARPNSEKLRWPASGKKGSETQRLSTSLRRVETVVVDPGHGGRDPGATGLRGLREKDVNLRLAHKLAAELKEQGFRVVLTRSDDQTLELEERMALAESSGGDLFVSVHANASARPATRGIEIYYLNVNDQRHNLGIAARENGIPRSEVDSLQRTLAKFRVGEVSLHSERLAEAVHTGLSSEFRQARNAPPDLGIKTGPFYVLFLSTMPSILVESGFLTNKKDAKLLRDEMYLDDLAEGIVAGLVRYRKQATSPEKES